MRLMELAYVGHLKLLLKTSFLGFLEILIMMTVVFGFFTRGVKMSLTRLA